MKLVATKLSRLENCCEIVGKSSYLGRWAGGGMRFCRTWARWEIAGAYYCTRHAKMRDVNFQPETKP